MSKVKDMKQYVHELEEKKKKIMLGGGIDAIKKQHEAGKLTARERINKLLDPDSFTEIDIFVKHRCIWFGMDKKDVPADAVITGYGKINGRTVFIYAQDFTSMGGTFAEMHAKKIIKLYDLAMKVGAPIIGIFDSGGARIQECQDSLSYYGKYFYKIVQASGVVPQIALEMGPCAGGQAYAPALMDFIFMVKGTSYTFIAGPPLVKAVTGEEISVEDLGGVEVHASISGVADLVTSNDEECLIKARELLSYLPSNFKEKPIRIETNDPVDRMIPELEEIVPTERNKSYDMYEVIKKIVDNGKIFDIKPDFAKNIITCFSRIGGYSVGIVANQPKVMAGAIDVDASDKASRFIRFCDAFNIPLIQFVDTPAFLIGSKMEKMGIIRHGAKMLYAYSEATVPKITIIIRKAYAGGYLAMCSKDLGADQVYAWPTAEIALVGPEAAASILYKDLLKKGDHEKLKEKTIEYIEEFCNPYVAAQRGYIDDVIKPRETRKRIYDALEMLKNKEENPPIKKHGNMPV